MKSVRSKSRLSVACRIIAGCVVSRTWKPRTSKVFLSTWGARLDTPLSDEDERRHLEVAEPFRHIRNQQLLSRGFEYRHLQIEGLALHLCDPVADARCHVLGAAPRAVDPRPQIDLDRGVQIARCQ